MLRFLLGLLTGAALAYAAMTYLPGRPLAVPELGGAPVETPRAAPGPLPSGVQGQLAAADRALAEAKQSGKAVPVTFSFSERDLTATAAAYFPQSFAGATLTNPVVRLAPGQIILTTTATAAIVRTTATVAAAPLVSDGRPAVRIESATIGGAPVPDQLREALAGQLAQAIAAGLPPKLTVRTIVAGEGTLTVTGTANP